MKTQTIFLYIYIYFINSAYDDCFLRSMITDNCQVPVEWITV